MKDRWYFKHMLSLSPEERENLEKYSLQGVLFDEPVDFRVFRDRIVREYIINRNYAVHQMNGQLKLFDVELTPDEVKERDAKVVRIDKNRRFVILPPKVSYKNPSAKSVSLPPGIRLGQLSEFFFSEKTVTDVVTPILSDMQMEYCQALAENRIWKARWIRIRGYWSFWEAIALLNVLKALAEIWRKGISG